MASIPKPGSTARWILTVGIVAVLLVTAFVYNNRLQDEQSELLASIAQSDQTISSFRNIDLTELQSEVAELERKANSARAQQNALSSRFREYTHSIEIGERMYSAANEADVVITKLSCAGPQMVELDGLAFNTYVYSIDARSEVPPQLLNFVSKLSDIYESGTIESLSMSLPQPDEDGVVSGETMLSLGFKVYYLSSPQQVEEVEEGAADGA